MKSKIRHFQPNYLLIASSLLMYSTGVRAEVESNSYDAAQQKDSATQVLKTIQISADTEKKATTEGNHSYTTKEMGTSTKLPLSIRETPQSVTVISRQQIEDRNFVTLDQAMELAPGVTAATANFNRVSYTARGFTFTNNMIDGMPSIADADAGYTPNLAFYDRVEVLRGAAGLIYGSGSAGGAVNLIRKRPTETAQASVNLQVGSWQNYYSDVDVSGPLNADEFLLSY